MSHRNNVVTGLALAVLVGCTPTEDSDSSRKPTVHTIEARVGLENGQIYIDDYHDEELVRPGDRVKWVCDCAPEIEFSVTEPAVLVEVDGLTGIERGDGWTRETLEELARRLQPTSNAELREVPEAGVDDLERPADDPVAAAGEFLRALAPALPARRGADQPPPRLFARPVPAGFVDGNSSIQSPPVVDRPGNRMWKFSWMFRLKANPAVQKPWDPHIYSTESF